MRVLIISDIHANLSALQAVLTDAGPVDAVWCLGDLVGYGPDPNECIETIQALPGLLCLVGNHDAAALNLIDISTFNPDARRSVLWTQNALTQSSKDYLAGLPERIETETVTLAHGSPRQPIWEYLLDSRTAGQNFAYFSTPYCFVGHSHLPVIFQMLNGSYQTDLLIPQPQISRQMTPRGIYNPGSVGQPRDRDPRASYAIFDPLAASWDYRRVSYDILAVQARMDALELPSRHSQRLSGGW